MAEEHEPSYYLEEAPELVGEDHWNFLGTDDCGPDVAYDEDFDFGADEGQAKVEDTESKDPDPKATNEMSEEQPPSFHEEPGLELVGEDHWDFLGINGFDPNAAYDEDFDFGTDEGSANVEPTASQDPDSKAIDREGTQEVVGVAREEEISQDGGSSQVMTEPTSNDVNKGIPEESVGAHEDVPQPSRDTERSQAVTAPTVTDSQVDSGTQSRVDQSRVDNEQFWQIHDEIFGSQNNLGNNNQQQFPFDFNNDDWRKYADQMANEDLPDMAGTGVQNEQQIADPLENEKHWDSKVHAQEHGQPVIHEPHSQRNIDKSPEHNRHPIYSRQRLAAQTPALDSGCDTSSVSRGLLQQPVPAKAHQSDNTAGRSGPRVMQGASRAMNPAANPQADDHDAAIDEAKSDDSDEEDEENVPDEVAFETFEESDPLIETPEDAPKKGWGRIGKRNGHEVWFNPKTSKWRKLYTFFLF